MTEKGNPGIIKQFWRGLFVCIVVFMFQSIDLLSFRNSHSPSFFSFQQFVL